MRALRLAPALLLALAACSVDTDSLKPKTDAECAVTGLKVCGNRCMPKDDPATGCGNPGCQPCPGAPAGDESYCDVVNACQVRPVCPVDPANPGRYVRCDPYGLTCDDLATSGTHCGACGHACSGASCSGGVCAPSAAGPALSGSQDLATDGTSVYQLVNDSPVLGQASVLRDGVPFAQWAGRASFLEADRNGFVAWDRSPGSKVWAAGPTGTPVTGIFTLSGRPISAALDPGYAYFVEDGGLALGETPADLVGLDRGSGARFSYTFAGETLWAVAIVQPGSITSDALVGTAGGSLRWVSWDGAREGTYATGVDVPIRLVVFGGLVGPTALPKTYAFWLGSSGALYRKEIPAGPVETLVPPVATTSQFLDLWADAEGVYWVDFTPGYAPFVAEWRAAHDDLLHLAIGDPADPPARVTATSGTLPAKVWWLTAGGTVYSVPR